MSLKNIQSPSRFLYLDNVCYFPPYDKSVFCAELPISSSEFFNAGIQDIRASLSLAVDTESDSPDADRLRYEGKVYAIYRRYPMYNGLTQIYLAEKAGVK